MVDVSKFEAEDAEGYKLTIFGKSVLVTEAMKNYLRDKLSKLERFHGHKLEVHVIMDIQRIEHVVVIVAKFDTFKIKVSADSTDMYPSIDEAVYRLQQKIRRWKDRIRDHHAKKLTATDITVNVLRHPYNVLEEINSDIEQVTKKAQDDVYQTPHVIGSEKLPLKVLTSEEAVMKMDLSGDHFLVFRSEEDQKLKVIYRRNDGHYGLILPE